ncbi:hypothetical protein CHS0354_039584 [Potamilus streckersoni]|uniref:Uncharacterized protein n=1 Tax=Potamilus streckersoni TaxID=2493646 RepID=A0AAE0RR11_9BIVA|nr:hypothetical protein CHS0354_039584 [Potamilus streckersoni]
MMNRLMLSILLIVMHRVQAKGDNHTTNLNLYLNNTEQSQHLPQEYLNNTEQRLYLPQEYLNNTEQRLYLQQKAQYMDQTITAGNTRCRSNNKCGFHSGTGYSWCYTDYSNNWDYCCTGICSFVQNGFYWCPSGEVWQYCGSHLYKDIEGRPCLETHLCGLHNEDGDMVNYWCLVDLAGNWGYCCAPYSLCEKHGMDYLWCYTTRSSSGTKWQYCKL